MKTWWLLYRVESVGMGHTKVWTYEPLFGKQLKRKLKAGWKVIE